jgi:hypothetical protein
MKLPTYPRFFFLTISLKSADEVLYDASPDDLEPLKIENFWFFWHLDLQQAPQSSQKVMTGSQEAAPVQVVVDCKLGKGLVENELVGPHKAKFWFDLTKVLPACFGLCEELLAQVPWVPILVSFFHLHYIE